MERCRVGIHLPFVGYVRPSGARSTRLKKGGAHNVANIDRVLTFFAAMREVPRELLEGFSSSRVNDQSFVEILFEEDEINRPILKQFMARRAKKSLVIPSADHLFDARNPIVEELASRALQVFTPIICLNDNDCPMTLGLMAQWGDSLPFKIMENQENVRRKIESRFAKLHIAVAEVR
jgi:hypothetical protein